MNDDNDITMQAFLDSLPVDGEPYFMIERNDLAQAHWLVCDVKSYGRVRWTPNSNEAKHHKTREGAEKYLAYVSANEPAMKAISAVVTEHLDMPRPSPAQMTNAERYEAIEKAARAVLHALDHGYEPSLEERYALECAIDIDPNPPKPPVIVPDPRDAEHHAAEERESRDLARLAQAERERDAATARADGVAEPTPEELASACAWLDERYPNINTRCTALLYGRMDEEHAQDRTADRIIATARALGWVPESAENLDARARVARKQLDEALVRAEAEKGIEGWQRVAAECIRMLEGAGLARNGTGNTLWAMTKAAAERIQALAPIPVHGQPVPRRYTRFEALAFGKRVDARWLETADGADPPSPAELAALLDAKEPEQ